MDTATREEKKIDPGDWVSFIDDGQVLIGIVLYTHRITAESTETARCDCDAYRLNVFGARLGGTEEMTFPNQRLGVGGVIFIIGSVIFIFNLCVILSRREKPRPIPIDGVGLMVLGIGIAVFLERSGA